MNGPIYGQDMAELGGGGDGGGWVKYILYTNGGKCSWQVVADAHDGSKSLTHRLLPMHLLVLVRYGGCEDGSRRCREETPSPVISRWPL